MDEGFFHQEGAAFTPTLRARGPWVEDSLHGRMISGLIGHVLDVDYPDVDFNLTRLTIDLVRPTRYDSVTITTKPFRDGNRIRVIDASVSIRGDEIAQARAVFLRRGEPPEGDIWTTPTTPIPLPQALPSPKQEGAGPEVTSWDSRIVSGRNEGVVERRVLWQRPRVPLLAGTEMGPLARTGLIADGTNPQANSGARGLVYINSDLSLYMHRPPVGEWICLEVTGHRADRGIAVGSATLHDLGGPFGQTVVGALANDVRR